MLTALASPHAAMEEVPYLGPLSEFQIVKLAERPWRSDLAIHSDALYVVHGRHEGGLNVSV
jgi:hypothetical protein